MKTVGILGGLGPLAGAHFYRRVVELSPATSDQAHIPIVLISDPTIPSRIAHLTGTGVSPLPKLTEICRKLIAAGAEIIALPSSTTSIYLNDLKNTVDVPIISLIDAVTEAINNAACTHIGIMATTPTRTFGVYDTAFASKNIEAVYPDSESQSEIMRLIMTVKGEELRSQASFGFDDLTRKLIDIASRDWVRGLDGILLGCTELPVIFQHGKNLKHDVSAMVFDSTDILANKVVTVAYGE